jgi:hypothetical protein
VTLTTNGSPEEVMAVAASYDDTLRYGAQTPFTDQLSFRWEGGMWEYDAYHSSIITAGNGGTKPALAAFTIFYNQGAEKYELKQTLQPDEQMWIDVGKLIREHVPDKNGKTLPADLTSGSYEIRDLTDIGIGSLFEGRVIFDKTYGHAAYGCANCCDYQHPFLIYDPLSIPLQGTSPNGAKAYELCSDIYIDISSYFMNNWSVVNTAIATVNYMGTHTGVGVGSTTSNTWALLSTGQQRNCPAYRVNLSGTADVTLPKVTIDSFSPNPIAKGSTANAHITVTPSANVTLTILSSGTGSATFGTSGKTTTQIPQTTTVNILAGAESNGNADLTLEASVGGTLMASTPFSVTTGACTATYSGNGGGGLLQCPSRVTLHDSYNLKEYCSSCQFSCIPVNFDNTFTPDPNGCSPNSGGFLGAGNQTLTSTEIGKFGANDCNVHNLQIQTTVTNEQGGKTIYTGGTLGLKCNANGSPSCP